MFSFHMRHYAEWQFELLDEALGKMEGVVGVWGEYGVR